MVRTDVCDGGLWGGVMVGFQHVYPDASVGVGSSVRKQLSKLSTSVWSGAALSGLAYSFAPTGPVSLL